PDSPARGRRPPAGVLAEELERAAARAQQRREHAEQRRLAGAVRAQQDDQLARVDGEVDAGEHRDPAELAAQALGDDRRPDQSPPAPPAPRMTASRTTARAPAPPRLRRPGRRGAPARRGRRSTPRAACPGSRPRAASPARGSPPRRPVGRRASRARSARGYPPRSGVAHRRDRRAARGARPPSDAITPPSRWPPSTPAPGTGRS